MKIKISSTSHIKKILIYKTFLVCKILSTIYCTPTTPPTGLDNYTFETTCKIYVPLSAVSSYKYRESWSKYASQIEGYDFE